MKNPVPFLIRIFYSSVGLFLPSSLPTINEVPGTLAPHTPQQHREKTVPGSGLLTVYHPQLFEEITS